MVENLHLWEGALGPLWPRGRGCSKLNLSPNRDKARLVPRGTVFLTNQGRRGVPRGTNTSQPTRRNAATISFNSSFRNLAGCCHTGWSGLSYCQEAVHANSTKPTEEPVSGSRVPHSRRRLGHCCKSRRPGPTGTSAHAAHSLGLQYLAPNASPARRCRRRNSGNPAQGHERAARLSRRGQVSHLALPHCLQPPAQCEEVKVGRLRCRLLLCCRFRRTAPGTRSRST